MKKSKHMNSYLRLLLYSLTAGVMAGIGSFFITEGTDSIQTFFELCAGWLRREAGVILWFFALPELAVAVVSYLKVEHLMKQEAQNLEKDVEDDSIDYQIEAWTTYANMFSYLIFILTLLMYTISLPSLPEDGLPFVAFRLPPFLLISVTIAVYGIAYVKQAQRRDPSKKGDPAQFRFSKDWLESCDEAERELTYQASYHAFQTMGWAFPLFFILTMVGHMIFRTGILAVFSVGILWGVSSLSYMLFKLKLLKTKLNQ